MRKRRVRLAEQQLAVMQVLWSRGEATVAEVRHDLECEPPLAHTTVATMLTRLESQGYVTSRSEGRLNVYAPKLRREDVSRTMVSDLAGRLFQGDVTEMFAHLLADSEVTSEELSRLRKLIRDKEKELRDGQ